MSNTKIIVVKLKQIIYGAIFIALGIVLVILLITLLKSGKDSTDARESAIYIPGKYTSVVELNGLKVNLDIVVDKDHINSITLVNLDEAVETMFPLLGSSVKELSDQLCNGVDINSIQVSEYSKHTQTLLLNAIEKTLSTARVASLDQ